MALARRLLAEHGRSTGVRSDRATLAATLRERGYDPHEAALGFEDAFGGLALWDEEAPTLVFGPAAALGSGFTIWPRGGPANAAERLVPVILGWDDTVWFVGADGRGWRASVLDRDALPAARDGSALVTQALLWRRLATVGPLETRLGAHGASLAAERGLRPIFEVSGVGEDWWGHPQDLVVEVPGGFGNPGPATYAAR